MTETSAGAAQQISTKVLIGTALVAISTAVIKFFIIILLVKLTYAIDNLTLKGVKEQALNITILILLISTYVGIITNYCIAIRSWTYQMAVISAVSFTYLQLGLPISYTAILIGTEILTTSLFVHRIRSESREYIKFNISRISSPWTYLLMLNFALAMTLNNLNTYGDPINKVKELLKPINNKIVEKLVDTTAIKTEITTSIPGINNDSINELLKNATDNSAQVVNKEQIELMILDQIESILRPYIRFLPLILAIGTFLLWLQILNLFNPIYMATNIALNKTLQRLHIIKIKKESVLAEKIYANVEDYD